MKKKIEKWASKEAGYLLNGFWGKGQWQVWDTSYQYAKKWLIQHYKKLHKKSFPKQFKRWLVTLRQD